MTRFMGLRKALESFVTEKGTATRKEMKEFLSNKDKDLTELDKQNIIQRATNSVNSPIARVGRGLYSTTEVEGVSVGVIPKIHHKIQTGIISVRKEMNSKTIDILNISEDEFTHIKEIIAKMKDLEECINRFNEVEE